MDEMTNVAEMATETMETVAAVEPAKTGILNSDAGKICLGAVMGAALADVGRILFGKLRKKRAEKKAAKAQPNKVDQICQEIEDSLKEK